MIDKKEISAEFRTLMQAQREWQAGAPGGESRLKEAIARARDIVAGWQESGASLTSDWTFAKR
jgi:hypothetical protein